MCQQAAFCALRKPRPRHQREGIGGEHAGPDLNPGPARTPRSRAAGSAGPHWCPEVARRRPRADRFGDGAVAVSAGDDGHRGVDVVCRIRSRPTVRARSTMSSSKVTTCLADRQIAARGWPSRSATSPGRCRLARRPVRGRSGRRAGPSSRVQTTSSSAAGGRAVDVLEDGQGVGDGEGVGDVLGFAVEDAVEGRRAVSIAGGMGWVGISRSSMAPPWPAEGWASSARGRPVDGAREQRCCG